MGKRMERLEVITKWPHLLPLNLCLVGVEMGREGGGEKGRECRSTSRALYPSPDGSSLAASGGDFN